MKRKSVMCIMVISFLFTNFLNAQTKGLEWNTFMGCGFGDYALDITLDSSGNIYVTGYSHGTWGSPVNTYNSGADIYVACLDSSGNLLWNTFLGCSGNDYGTEIALDSSGNVYVTGYCYGTWGSPVNAYSGLWEASVACLDSSGNLLWNTFLGSASDDYGQGIFLDGSGNVYVTGYGSGTWGSPVNSHSGGNDVFVACLNSSGSLVWNTFLGSAGNDYSSSITLDSSGNIYVTGYGYATWGTPVNAYTGSLDVIVACLGSSGSLIWNTFLGSDSAEYGIDITRGSSGNIYVTGYSTATWGSPVNAYSGDDDAFTACLNSSGSLIWNTFLGSASEDRGYSIALDNSENVYVTGPSLATWGSPVNAYSGDDDAFVAGLDSSGNLRWNTFLASSSEERGYSIVPGVAGTIHVAGYSESSWGSPVNAHSGGDDIFVAKLNTDPLPDITANGSDGPVSISESDSLKIRVSLNRFGASDNVDYWLAYRGPSGWVHYNNSTKKWETGLGVTHQGALMDLNNKKVFQSSGLAPGNYTFYFGVDMDMNGKVTKSSLYKDEVKVTVTSN